MADTHLASQSRLLKDDSFALGQGAVEVPVGSESGKGREPAAAVRPEPEVDFTRTGDGAIEWIVVHCTCGQEIRLRCEYLEDGGADEHQAC